MACCWLLYLVDVCLSGCASPCRAPCPAQSGRWRVPLALGALPVPVHPPASALRLHPRCRSHTPSTPGHQERIMPIGKLEGAVNVAPSPSKIKLGVH